MKCVGGIVIIAALSIPGFKLQAQSCSDYFPQKEGAILEYVNYDKKGKVTGGSEMTFKDKKQTAEGISAVFASSFKDDQGEVLFENEVQVECRNGVLYLDASNLLDPATMSAYESMDVKVTGENLELPLDAPAGTVLADGGVTAVVSSGGMKIMTISVNMSNRKIVAREKIETPAGTFDCIKYTYDAHSQMGFVKVNLTGVEWYNHEVGTIRSESYDKKGKLSGYTILESIR